MQHLPRSERCSLMAKPGDPPAPKTRPADCPKDAAYIKTTDAGGSLTLPDAPFPLVFEGGDGNDSVTVRGNASHGIIVAGGKGDDSLLVEGTSMPLSLEAVPVWAVVLLGALLITFATIAVLGWRALGNASRRND